MYGNQSGEFLSWPRLKFISLCPNTSSYQRLFIWKIGKKTKNVFLHVALFFCLYHLCRYYFYFILLSRYGFKIITVRWIMMFFIPVFEFANCVINIVSKCSERLFAPSQWPVRKCFQHNLSVKAIYFFWISKYFYLSPGN